MMPEDLRLALKRLETERDAALRSAQARADLIASVSHDMRTPLNGILGFTQLLLEDQVADNQRELLELIDNSAESLLTLVNDLLDYSKIEAGMLDIDPIPFNAAHTVRESVRSLELIAAKKGLDLTYAISPRVPAEVIGDPVRLRQVLVNLVGNALKFTAAGGVTITVDAGAIEPSRVELRLSVADTGIGIAPDRLDAIFDPFEQAERSTTRSFGGTGLGLTISRRLMELMGGNLSVQSEPGRGSVFTISAPFGAAAPNYPGPKKPDRSSTRVVLLTDSERTSVLDALAGTSVEVIRANDPSADSVLLKRTAADLIVVDVRDNALRAATAVMAVVDGGKVIVLTPSGSRGDAQRCRRLGVSAYLTGSLTNTEMTAAVDAVISGVPGLITRHWLREKRNLTSTG